MKKIYSYEWCEVWADERDPNAGGASHEYRVDGWPLKPDDPIPGYAEVNFQHGPRGVEGSKRGCLDDHILAIVEDRMAGFQAGPFAHPKNAEALEHIQAARTALRERAEERRARGVLGENKA